MSEIQRGSTPHTGSLLMNVHGDAAGHFIELRLMKGEQGTKLRQISSPGSFQIPSF